MTTIPTVTTVDVQLEDLTLSAGADGIFVDMLNKRHAVSQTAQQQLANLLNMRRLATQRGLVLTGPQLAERANDPGKTVHLAVVDDAIGAATTSDIYKLNQTRVLADLEARGYTVSMAPGNATVMNAIRRSGNASAGNEEYVLGRAVRVDLAGHELPSVDMYFERLICTNGATARVFGEEHLIRLDQQASFDRNQTLLAGHLDATGDGDQQSVLDRLELAYRTPASLSEILGLRSALRDADGLSLSRGADSFSESTESAIKAMLGNWPSRFGVGSLNEIPAKRRRDLAADVSMAGAINLATEVVTWSRGQNELLAPVVRWLDRSLHRNPDLAGMTITPAHARLPDFWLN